MSNGINGAEKRALLVGINKYPKLSKRHQLNGCVNDVELMAKILQTNFGFPEANVEVLRDEEATRDGILAALSALAEATSEDDIVVVHYSGHGSQRTAQNPALEPDGLDETIVPHDSGRGAHPNQDITDKEIYAWLLRLRDVTPYVTFIFDSCHSGTITRDAFGGKERSADPDKRPWAEFGVPEVDFGSAEGASKDLGTSGWLPLSERYVLIAGCHDEESSFEHRTPQESGGLMQGALTYFLSQELVKATPGTTYRDVFELASHMVTDAHKRQHPQMEGARDRELFGVVDIEPLRFVPVTKRDGDKVTLAAGAAQGLTIGSLWAIYPQATKQVTEETPKLGLVEIRTVRAVTSDANIMNEEEVGTIAPNARAVEESHFFGEMQLLVEIQAAAGFEEAVADLEQRIVKSELLRLAEGDEPGQVRVYLLAPRKTAGYENPVPQVGSLNEATWAVVGEDGRLMMPLHHVAEANVAFVLRDNLEKAARYRQALALENPNEESPLRDTVDLILLRKATDGTWVEARPENDGGQIVYEDGEGMAFRIVNNHSAPLHVTVLDFGMQGAVGQLHPIPGSQEKLEPGGSVEVGVIEGDELDLFLPDDFDVVPDPEEGKPRGDTETFKLFATTQAADFSKLVQEEGYRDLGTDRGKGADSPLGQLLDMALTGQGMRTVRRKRRPPAEEWTTVKRSFFLQAGGL